MLRKTVRTFLRHRTDGTSPVVIIPNDPETEMPVEAITGDRKSVAQTYIGVTEDKKRDVTLEKTFDQKPLKVHVSEKLSGLELLLIGVDTVSVLDPKADYVTEDTSGVGVGVDRDDEDWVDTTKVLNLRVRATDEVGNMGLSKILDDVKFDSQPLKVTEIFPRSGLESGLVDTVTNATVDVRMQINEAADSISVRWVQVGADKQVADSKINDVSPNDLTKVSKDIRVDFSTSFVNENDDKDYTLQIFARDVVGNITLTPPDTLFFNDDFVNPVADTFLVTRKDDLPDSSIVGQKLTLEIEAQSEDGNIAVTYPDKEMHGDVRVKVLVLNTNEDPEMTHVLAAPGSFTIRKIWKRVSKTRRTATGP